jgi:hypothetical protein
MMMMITIINLFNSFGLEMNIEKTKYVLVSRQDRGRA